MAGLFVKSKVGIIAARAVWFSCRRNIIFGLIIRGFISLPRQRPAAATRAAPIAVSDNRINEPRYAPYPEQDEAGSASENTDHKENCRPNTHYDVIWRRPPNENPISAAVAKPATLLHGRASKSCTFDVRRSDSGIQAKSGLPFFFSSPKPIRHVRGRLAG